MDKLEALARTTQFARWVPKRLLVPASDTIRRRLTVGFGLVVVMLAVVAVQANIALRRLERDSRATLEQSRREYDDAQRLVTAMLGEIAAAMQYVNSNTARDDARYEARAREVDSLRSVAARLTHLSAAQHAHMETIGRIQGALEVRIGVAQALQLLGRRTEGLAALDTAAVDLATLDTTLAAFRRETASSVERAEAALWTAAARSTAGVTVLSVIALALAVFSGVSASRAVAAPLDRLVAQARALSRGDFQTSTAMVAMPGEFAVLAAALNHAGTELDTLHSELTRQAFHDSLTGLPNRARFFVRLEGALSLAFTEGDPERVAVLLIDLDGFKGVNDTRGHAAGDDVLRQVTGRLLDATRGSDTVARLGGDEFAVLVANVRGEADVRRVAERIISAIAAPFTIDGAPVAIAASVGVARMNPTSTVSHTDVSTAGVRDEGAAPDAAATAALLVREADSAMYRAKAEGRGRFVLASATERSTT